MTRDETYMRRCLELARRGISEAAPNPMVGAVLASGDAVIAEGHHERFGGAHAEVNAIRAAASRDALTGSTLYVNLEPCSHFGKTPPCAELIVSSAIPRVVIGTPDIFEKVRGRGIEILRAAGVSLTVGVLPSECLELNKRFFVFHSFARPYVILKWAETGDGFIARSDYSSKWISCEESRALAHRWRSEESCVLVGSATARHDDPQLNVRMCAGRSPIRAVVDNRLELPASLKLFDGSQDTLVFNALRSGDREPVRLLQAEPGPNLARSILDRLREQRVLSILVEGGARLLQTFIDAGLWDEARVFVADSARFGSGIAAPRLEGAPAGERQVGSDRLIEYRNRWLAQIDPLRV